MLEELEGLQVERACFQVPFSVIDTENLTAEEKLLLIALYRQKGGSAKKAAGRIRLPMKIARDALDGLILKGYITNRRY